MMVDFALEAEREHGKNSEEAIYQACLLRFRPIMMTTMAALLGGLPLALGTGVGSELRRPLGITIVGGLIVGAAEKLGEVFWGPPLGGAIEDWFAYMMALVFLLFRPQGLFGERIIERV